MKHLQFSIAGEEEGNVTAKVPLLCACFGGMLLKIQLLHLKNIAKASVQFCIWSRPLMYRRMAPQGPIGTARAGYSAWLFSPLRLCKNCSWKEEMLPYFHYGPQKVLTLSYNLIVLSLPACNE